MNFNPDVKEIKENIKAKLTRLLGCSPKDADTLQMYKATVMSVRDLLNEKRVEFRADSNKAHGKRVYYVYGVPYRALAEK